MCVGKGGGRLKKSRLLILDANIVLELSRTGLWESFTEKYEVFVSAIVAEESQFFEDESGRQYIDLSDLIESGLITILEAPVAEVKAFCERFGPDYFSRLDPGEAESLTILLRNPGKWRICSADAIVFKTIGNLREPDLCISLEKAFSEVGLGRPLDWQYTEAFRKKFLEAGSVDRLQGRGLTE